MNIRERRAIRETASHVLNRTPSAAQIILIYAGIGCALSLCSTFVSAIFSNRISGAGGLGNIGLRSVLSTGQSMLPLVTTIVTACLNLGYHTAMLSFTRGFDANHRTLFGGFRNFGPLLRLMLLQGLVYFGAAMAAVYLSSFIFVATPFAEGFMKIMEPYLTSMTVMDNGLVLDEAALMQAAEAMVPMMWIMLAVCLLLITPIYYRFRMSTFCLADDPRLGAIHAVLKSRKLMRRNCFALFRLDLSFWWYYLGMTLVSLVCYGDVLLPMVGVTFPWSDTVSFYLFLILSLAMQFFLQWFGMNRVYAAYAVAYDALQEDFPQPELPAQM